MNLLGMPDRKSTAPKARAILILFPRFLDVTLVSLSLSEALVVPDRAWSVESGQACALRIVSAEGWQLIEVEAEVTSTEPYVRLALTNVGPGLAQALHPLLDRIPTVEPRTTQDVGALLRPRVARRVREIFAWCKSTRHDRWPKAAPA